jgi:hypothetical protein
MGGRGAGMEVCRRPAVASATTGAQAAAGGTERSPRPRAPSGAAVCGLPLPSGVSGLRSTLWGALEGAAADRGLWASARAAVGTSSGDSVSSGGSTKKTVRCGCGCGGCAAAAGLAWARPLSSSSVTAASVGSTRQPNR